MTSALEKKQEDLSNLFRTTEKKSRRNKTEDRKEAIHFGLDEWQTDTLLHVFQKVVIKPLTRQHVLDCRVSRDMWLTRVNHALIFRSCCKGRSRDQFSRDREDWKKNSEMASQAMHASLRSTSLSLHTCRVVERKSRQSCLATWTGSQLGRC